MNQPKVPIYFGSFHIPQGRRNPGLPPFGLPPLLQNETRFLQLNEGKIRGAGSLVVLPLLSCKGEGE